MKAHIDVMLKPEVHDPQGQAVGEALRRLGHEVGRVRFGKRIELELPLASDESAAREAVADMCRVLLSNPVIEDYRIEFSEEVSGSA